MSVSKLVNVLFNNLQLMETIVPLSVCLKKCTFRSVDSGIQNTWYILYTLCVCVCLNDFSIYVLCTYITVLVCDQLTLSHHVVRDLDSLQPQDPTVNCENS